MSSSANSLAVPQPETVSAVYLVATSALVADQPESMPPLPPAGLLLARGDDPADVDRLESLPYATAVVYRAPLAEAAGNCAHVLATAREIARTHGGLVVDAIVPRIITADHRPSPAATAWFVFEHIGEIIATHGLARFGLPELYNDQSDQARIAMYDAVLVGVAQRLVEEWPANDPVGPATITLRDVARGYGDASAGGDDPTLRRGLDVTLSYDGAAHRLVVALHDDPADLFA